MNDFFAPKPKENEPWDTAIIGSGPAGLTAAIYLTRGAASTILFAGDQWGGQLMLTTQVDNYPGFPEGILGPDLMSKIRSQAARFGTEIIEQNVTSLEKKDKIFIIKAGEKNFFSKSVIITTGAKTRWLEVPGEEKLRGRGVSSCAPCDAPFFKDKKVAVIGGGDSAMEEALVLTKYASEVTIIHRREEFKASQAMQKKVMSNEKIKIVWNSEVVEFIGETNLEKIKIKNTLTQKEKEIDFEGAFVAIGHDPASEIFKGLLELDEKGYIKKFEKNGFKTATSQKGIFVAGDVHDSHYRQAITAAGFGCMAAMDALNYLDKDTPSW